MWKFSLLRWLLPAAALCLALLAGCASREGALRSKNYERVRIEGATEKQIYAAAEKAFAAHGFFPAADTTPQELVLMKKTPWMFRFVKGGDAVVWLVLEPKATGWDVYCVPEPSGLYPGGSALRFGGLLCEIQTGAAHVN